MNGMISCLEVASTTSSTSYYTRGRNMRSGLHLDTPLGFSRVFHHSHMTSPERVPLLSRLSETFPALTELRLGVRAFRLQFSILALHWVRGFFNSCATITIKIIPPDLCPNWTASSDKKGGARGVAQYFDGKIIAGISETSYYVVDRSCRIQKQSEKSIRGMARSMVCVSIVTDRP